MSNLLARYAQCMFWMARQIERAEDLARILDVNETFSRDSRGYQDWAGVLQLYGDEARFRAMHGEPTTEKVIAFYTSDTANPGSILSTIWMARENARTLRPLISTELWVHLNIYFNRLRADLREPVDEAGLARLCRFVKENCQTHSGIAESTIYRDEGWAIYSIGKHLERADQTTRLIEVKVRLLTDTPDTVGQTLDSSQWYALLRSVSGYQAFRRVNPSGLQPGAVADFLLHDHRFPRSLACASQQLAYWVDFLRTHYHLGQDGELRRPVDDLGGLIAHQSAATLDGDALYAFTDRVQRALIDLSNALNRDLFGLPAKPPSPFSEQEQSAGRS